MYYCVYIAGCILCFAFKQNVAVNMFTQFKTFKVFAILQSHFGYPATLGPAPIQISNLAEFGSYA